MGVSNAKMETGKEEGDVHSAVTLYLDFTLCVVREGIGTICIERMNEYVTRSNQIQLSQSWESGTVATVLCRLCHVPVDSEGL